MCIYNRFLDFMNTNTIWYYTAITRGKLLFCCTFFFPKSFHFLHIFLLSSSPPWYLSDALCLFAFCFTIIIMQCFLLFRFISLDSQYLYLRLLCGALCMKVKLLSKWLHCVERRRRRRRQYYYHGIDDWLRSRTCD